MQQGQWVTKKWDSDPFYEIIRLFAATVPPRTRSSPGALLGTEHAGPFVERQVRGDDG